MERLFTSKFYVIVQKAAKVSFCEHGQIMYICVSYISWNRTCRKFWFQTSCQTNTVERAQRNCAHMCECVHKFYLIHVFSDEMYGN